MKPKAVFVGQTELQEIVSAQPLGGVKGMKLFLGKDFVRLCGGYRFSKERDEISDNGLFRSTTGQFFKNNMCISTKILGIWHFGNLDWNSSPYGGGVKLSIP